jgi:PAB-dependent poly(A)-specific ribonuclease subunit 3
MVEVTWNGSTFFVPASTAYAYQEQPDGAEFEYENVQEDEGFDWANGSTALPAPPKRTLQCIGIPEPVRSHFQNLDLASLGQMSPEDERYKEIPPRYHSALLLDDPSIPRGAGGSFGYPSALYKVVDQTDSQLYALRRFDNARCTPLIIKSALARWSEIRHPSIVSLYGISQERGALFFAHAYHPGAETLKQRYIDPRSSHSQGPVISEPLLLRILIQLISGMRLLHSRGLAVRSLHPAHVLLTSGTVARINSVGVADVLEFESRKTVLELQADDLVKLGLLMLSLATKSIVSAKTAEQSLQRIRQQFSTDMCRVVAALLSGTATIPQVPVPIPL